MAPAAPPPTLSALEVQQAKIDAARQAKARRGLSSTILSGLRPPGEVAGTGDASAAGSASNAKTSLLGGG